MQFLSLAVALGALAPLASHSGPEPRPVEAALPSLPSDAPALRLRLQLDEDAAAHGAFLDELAELRRTGQHAAFTARLEAERAAQAARRAPLIERVRALGGRVIDSSWLVPQLIVELPESGRAELAADSAVRSLGEQRTELRRPASLIEAIDPQHHDHLSVHQRLIAGAPVEGTGVTVAVIDSGIDVSYQGQARAHRAFYRDGQVANGTRIVEAVSSGLATTGDDQNGHGTRVASVLLGAQWAFIAGTGDGAAPDAFVRSFRIDDPSASGGASTGHMAQAFESAAARPDVRVANMSYDGNVLASGNPNLAIDAAVRSGILVTLSAGNSGAAQDNFRHGALNALSIGASFLDQKRPVDDPTLFVSAGGRLPDGRRYPQLIAVGEDVTSAVLDNENVAVASNGTSASAALVAGAAALALQAAPGLSEIELRALLVNSSEEVLLGDPEAAGYGYLNAKRAFDTALAGNLTRTDLTASPQVTRYQVALTAGVPFSATAAWNQVDPDPVLNRDLDLRLVDDTGAVLASSSERVGTLEQVRHVPTNSESYFLEVEHFSGAAFSYALASDVIANAQSIFNSCLSGPVLFSAQASDLEVPPTSQGLITYASGCGLSATQSVSVGFAGLSVPFDIVSDRVLRIEVPGNVGLVAGSQPVVVDLGGGLQLQSSLVLGVGKPVLVASNTVSAGAFGDQLVTRVYGEPNAPYLLGYSSSLVPTLVPGIVQVDLGNAGTQLGVVNSVLFVEPEGDDLVFWGTFSTLTPGTTFYMQAAVFDFTLLGLTTSNLESVFVIP